MTENINPGMALRQICEKNYSDKGNNLEHEIIEIKKQQSNILENQKALFDLLKAVQDQMVVMQDQNTKQLAKIQVTLNQIIQKEIPPKLAFHFPINSVEILEDMDNKIEQEFEKFVTLIRHIILPEGLGANINKLLSQELIMSFNYKGVHGKKAFATYTNINKALFEALNEEGYTHAQYVKDLRSAFQSYKNKHYKKTYKAKKKATETGKSAVEEMLF